MIQTCLTKPKRCSVTKRASTLYSEALRVMTDRIEQKLGSYGERVHVGVDTMCVYCDDRMANTLDHVVSIVRNGRLSGYGNSPHNLVPCCALCNSSKGAQPWEPWMLRKFGDTAQTRARIDAVAAHIRRARPHEIVPGDDMYGAIKKRCYVVCSLLHDLSVACGDDPEYWEDHVAQFDARVMDIPTLCRSDAQSTTSTPQDSDSTE